MTAKPLNPYLVLAVAVFLPGMGHVLMGAHRRALLLQFFMVALAFVTWHLTTPETSLAGRLAGGLFVYAMSLPEAYRLARLRSAGFHAGLAAG
jgi:hypothetical protein